MAKYILFDFPGDDDPDAPESPRYGIVQADADFMDSIRHALSVLSKRGDKPKGSQTLSYPISGNVTYLKELGADADGEAILPTGIEGVLVIPDGLTVQDEETVVFQSDELDEVQNTLMFDAEGMWLKTSFRSNYDREVVVQSYSLPAAKVGSGGPLPKDSLAAESPRG